MKSLFKLLGFATCLEILVSLHKPGYLNVARDIPQPHHSRAGKEKQLPLSSGGTVDVLKDKAAAEWCWAGLVGPYQERVSSIFVDFPLDPKRQEVHIAKKKLLVCNKNHLSALVTRQSKRIKVEM